MGIPEATKRRPACVAANQTLCHPALKAQPMHRLLRYVVQCSIYHQTYTWRGNVRVMGPRNLDLKVSSLGHGVLDPSVVSEGPPCQHG